MKLTPFDNHLINKKVNSIKGDPRKVLCRCQKYSMDIILKYKKTFKARHHNIGRTCNIWKSSTRKRYFAVVKHGIPPQHRRNMATKDAQIAVLLLLLSSMSVLSYCKYQFLPFFVKIVISRSKCKQEIVLLSVYVGRCYESREYRSFMHKLTMQCKYWLIIHFI